MCRRSAKSQLKARGLTPDLVAILIDWRIIWGAGTVGVVVKYVDINWNTEGEGKYLRFS